MLKSTTFVLRMLLVFTMRIIDILCQSFVLFLTVEEVAVVVANLHKFIDV